MTVIPQISAEKYAFES